MAQRSTPLTLQRRQPLPERSCRPPTARPAPLQRRRRPSARPAARSLCLPAALRRQAASSAAAATAQAVAACSGASRAAATARAACASRRSRRRPRLEVGGTIAAPGPSRGPNMLNPARPTRAAGTGGGALSEVHPLPRRRRRRRRRRADPDVLPCPQRLRCRFGGAQLPRLRNKRRPRPPRPQAVD
jgi:hypothetical protein